MQPGIGSDLFEIYSQFKGSKAAAEKQNRLLEIGGLAGRGDYSGAANKALGYGDFEAGNSLLQIASGQKKERQIDKDRLAGALFAAKTPEEWGSVIQYAKSNGIEMDPEEEDFNTGKTLLMRHMTPEGQLRTQQADRSYALQERGFNADQANADRNYELEVQKLNAPKPNSGFTLGEGQTRYGPNGEVLAAGPPKTVQPRALTSVDKNAILEADDQVQAGTNVIDMLNRALAINEDAGSGALAGTQAFVARNDPTGFFDDKKGAATTEFNNIVLNQALSSMKSIFGGNPTEGERAVLVQLQGAADKSPVERKAIIERGIELAKRRVAFNKERAEEIRGGSYFGGASTVQPSGQQGSNDTGTIFGEAGEVPEGAVVEDDQGNRYRKTNGTLEAIQ